MKKILVVCLFLAGCSSTAISTKLTVVTPPDQMYDCPIKKQWPNWQKLNDTEVAKTVVELYKNNSRCKASVDAIQKYLTDAKARLEN
jgi:hypothetical protein